MKPNVTLLNTRPEDGDDEQGDAHAGTSVQTPLRPDAFVLSDEEKMARIAYHFREIMETLGLDLTDDSLSGTPRRVAKMYVQELFTGLNPGLLPAATLFDNKFGYDQMLVEKNISFNSVCEHHFVPIIGQAHVAYRSSGKVIGLSKLNRIVEYFAKRPQVQERLTRQIGLTLQEILQTPDVAVLLDARHFCIAIRGVEDHASTTITSFYGGVFEQEAYRNEFLNHVH